MKKMQTKKHYQPSIPLFTNRRKIKLINPFFRIIPNTSKQPKSILKFKKNSPKENCKIPEEPFTFNLNSGSFDTNSLFKLSESSKKPLIITTPKKPSKSMGNHSNFYNLTSTAKHKKYFTTSPNYDFTTP